MCELGLCMDKTDAHNLATITKTCWICKFRQNRRGGFFIVIWMAY